MSAATPGDNDTKRTGQVTPVPLPGEPFDGTVLEAFGVVITDEARAEFKQMQDEITAAERAADKHLHDRIYGVPMDERSEKGTHRQAVCFWQF